MKNFTELKLDNSPRGQKVIDYAVGLSGLPEEVCKTLYESMTYNMGGAEISDVDAMQMFNEYFKVDTPIDVNVFSQEIVDDMKKIGDLGETSQKRRSYTKHLMSILKRYLFKNDTPSMLEVLCCVLKLKDQENGTKLLESLHVGTETMKTLNESLSNLDFGENAARYISGTPFTAEDASDDVQFYTELKYLLDQRFKDYSGQPVHIQNIYQTIMEYVDKRAQELQSDAEVMQTDESQYGKFLEHLINSPHLDGMYLSADYLKTITSDVQTLLFDLMIIINTYVSEMNKKYGDYVDPEKIYEYRIALAALAKMIASSKVHSKYGAGSSEDLRSWSLTGYLQMNHFGRVALDCTQIMKSLQGEFNLNIRKCLNLYVSKAMELIHSLKDVKNKLHPNVVIQ